MRQLEVPAHVFVCVDGEHVVFLDLRNDRYWAVEAAGTCALTQTVRGWPTEPADGRQRLGSDQAEHPAARSEPSAARYEPSAARYEPSAARYEPNAARLLIEKGLLCDPHDASKPATPIRVEPPRLELLSEAASAGRGKTGAMRFLLAAAVAAAAFRYQSFERLIDRTRRRKQVHGANIAMLDVTKAAEVVADFEALRPLLFSARDACLLSSFVLIEQLARQDLFPQWVFGVQARPFAAHCWIQHEDILFNDTVDHVTRYTPIMAI